MRNAPLVLCSIHRILLTEQKLEIVIDRDTVQYVQYHAFCYHVCLVIWCFVMQSLSEIIVLVKLLTAIFCIAVQLTKGEKGSELLLSNKSGLIGLISFVHNEDFCDHCYICKQLYFLLSVLSLIKFKQFTVVINLLL